LLDGQSVGRGGLEASHQLLDFLLLGQEDLGREVLFFKPVSRWTRVCSMMSWAYWSTNVWNW
jgi:hypothetical protein